MSSSPPNREAALAAKNRGNEFFQKGDYEKASEAFTEAITADPTDHIFYSNRSGAWAGMKRWDLALEDANKCIELNSNFAKGYGRRAAALHGLGKLNEAEAAVNEGLKIDPASQQLKDALEDIKKEAQQSFNPFARMFGPDMWVKLNGDPVTREYLKDPEYVNKMKMLQVNPNLMDQMISDQKIGNSFGVLLGISGLNVNPAGAPKDDSHMEDISEEPKDNGEGHTTATGVEVLDDDDETPISKPSKPKVVEMPKFSTSSAAPKPPPPKKEVSPAEVEKEAGNALYMKKQFAEALEHYNKASELAPKNIVYLNNIAAAQCEMKEYSAAVATCDKAVEVGRENGANFKDIAKAFFRQGNAYAAMNKVEEAIEAYNRSQVEDYSDKTKNAIKKLEQVKKEHEAKAYINPEKSEEHKKKGNDLFADGKWADAITEYSEALKRNPENYKVYSNRAACYAKLMDWQRGLDDCDACLARDPKFVKAFIRKGKIQHFLKQYHKALETFDKGLEIDPNASELIEARRETVFMINSTAGDPERAKEAMKDPEIQAIMKDPMVNKVLSDMQEDPKVGQAAMADPTIRSKIEKLIASGILSVK